MKNYCFEFVKVIFSKRPANDYIMPHGDDCGVGLCLR